MLHNAKRRRELHRANLRTELVAAAHRLVQDEGYEGLTIRKLAKRAGLAPMSVYSYFADKQDILYALAEDAFAVLARRIEDNRTDDPVAALKELIREYAAFGLDNPNEYRTVFMTRMDKPPEGRSFDEMEASNPAKRALVVKVGACIAAGRLKGDANAIATLLWAAVHGAISLLITFPPQGFGDGQAFVARMGDLALAGLTVTDVAPLGGGAERC